MAGLGFSFHCHHYCGCFCFSIRFCSLFVLSFLSDVSAKGAVKEGLNRGTGARIFTRSPTPWVAGASWLYQGLVPHLPFASEFLGGLMTFRWKSVCAPTQGTKEQGWWLEQEELRRLMSKSSSKEKVIVLFPAKPFKFCLVVSMPICFFFCRKTHQTGDMGQK